MKRLIPWLAAIVIISGMFATIYGVIQQELRMSANDPQIQLAEDTAAALDSGTSPASATSSRVDFAHSLAPFIDIYDTQGRPVAGSGYLDGHLPQVPFGVLQHANGKPYYFITWQPTGDVRVASVEVAAKHYYVLAGRNLAEVENREIRAMLLSLIGWVCAMVVLAITYALMRQSPGSAKRS